MSALHGYSSVLNATKIFCPSLQISSRTYTSENALKVNNTG